MKEDASFLPPDQIPHDWTLRDALHLQDIELDEARDIFRQTLVDAGAEEKAIDNLIGFDVLQWRMKRIRELQLSSRDTIMDLLRWVHEHQRSALFRVRSRDDHARSAVKETAGPREDRSQSDSRRPLAALIGGSERKIAFIDLLSRQGLDQARSQMIWQVAMVFSREECFQQLEDDSRLALKVVLEKLGLDGKS